jgi:serine/threonine-protein kinase PknG
MTDTIIPRPDPPARCNRSGCDGIVDSDGYCLQCGHPQAAADSASNDSGSVPTTTAGSRRITRGGLGLVDLEPIPRRDPRQACLSNPIIPESKRFCKNGHPTGPRIEGECPECGAPFRFVPKLRRGDVVSRQYEVAGCLAYGGLGWVYLVQNRNVDGRWEVLKGLRHGDDPEAVEAAISERRFLAQVKHDKIVQIHNFVEHNGDGYIVMEYVAGTTLKELTRDMPLDLDRAIAYVLQALEALGYLHGLGLVYCDLKPENLIAIDQSVKLIDLGAVHRIGDVHSAVYGTKGFWAPEVAEGGTPSVSSDLYTVGRTLALLAVDVPEYQRAYASSLPPRDVVPQFVASDSFFRFERKATAPDPVDRFQSADEMADQLLGVLHEVGNVPAERKPPFASERFAPPYRLRHDATDWRSLPVVVDGNETEDPVVLELRVARALIDTGRWREVDITLDGIATVEAHDWRVAWHRGLAALARGELESARTWFDTVYSDVPGELVPKLAIALASERMGDLDAAVELYDVVSKADPNVAVAAFGLARCELAAGRSTEALRAYERVPAGSAAYVEARVARARLLVESRVPAPTLKQLCDAADELDGLGLGDSVRAAVAVELLSAALDLVTTDDASRDPTTVILGHPVTEEALRRGLEVSYRTLASFALTWQERVRYVDLANQVRPWSWT